jgi:hypothetical protein
MPLPFITNPVYTDDGMPLGAIALTDIKRGLKASPTTIAASAVLENWTFNDASDLLTRPDQIGGPNGFNIVGKQPTASGKIQIATATTETVKNGDWFSYVRDGKSGATAEIWVIYNIADVHDYGTYRHVTCSAALSYNQP